MEPRPEATPPAFLDQLWFPRRRRPTETDILTAF